MQVKFMKRAVLSALGAASMLVAGVAQAALQDRDLDGNGVTDAFYDTDRDITWLRDANVNGTMNWATAVSWADGFSFGGYTDWRLPTSDTCNGANCTGSELGHLWYSELGNTAGLPMTNTGGFQDLQKTGIYWSGTESVAFPSYAWRFAFYGGGQSQNAKTVTFFYGMAVRPGDVAAVPEPETYVLMLAGLAALALARRHRKS